MEIESETRRNIVAARTGRNSNVHNRCAAAQITQLVK